MEFLGNVDASMTLFERVKRVEGVWKCEFFCSSLVFVARQWCYTRVLTSCEHLLFTSIDMLACAYSIQNLRSI